MMNNIIFLDPLKKNSLMMYYEYFTTQNSKTLLIMSVIRAIERKSCDTPIDHHRNLGILVN